MRWKPGPASGWEAFVLGSTSGLVAYALLTTFLPEMASDATREHLPDDAPDLGDRVDWRS